MSYCDYSLLYIIIPTCRLTVETDKPRSLS